MFIKYPHLEKWGSDETVGLENGQDYLYVFPKLDGTNASVWYNFEQDTIECGSRNRKLSRENDNQGFCNRVLDSESISWIKNTLSRYKNWTLYGEWLVKHTISAYLPDAWRRFYVFDVFDRETQQFIPYEEYRDLIKVLNEYDNVFQLIPPLAVSKKLSDENISRVTNENFFLLQEGNIGEGVVVKRYGFVNRYGETTWAKVVRSEFKAKHVAAMGPRVINAKDSIEDKIVSQFLSEHLILKTLAKVLNESESEKLPSKKIPDVLNRVWYDFIHEELWGALKQFKNPQLDFKVLQKLIQHKTKTVIGI